jgi:hypothetical protein
MIIVNAFDIKKSEYMQMQSDYEDLLRKLDPKAAELVNILFYEENEPKLYIKRNYGTLFIHSSNVAILLRQNCDPIYLERNEVAEVLSHIDMLYAEQQTV